MAKRKRLHGKPARHRFVFSYTLESSMIGEFIYNCGMIGVWATQVFDTMVEAHSNSGKTLYELAGMNGATIASMEPMYHPKGE